MGNNNQPVNISIRKFPIHQSSVGAKLPLTAEKSLTIYLELLNTQLNNMLSNADDHFFDKSGKSDDSRHFAALRALRVKKQGLLNVFKQEIINDFRKTLGKFDDSYFFNSADIETLPVEALSLVGNDDLEEQIAIDTMVNKARKHNALALDHLCQRLDVLLPSKVISEAINPFDPFVVCNAFSHALKPIDLGVEFQLVLYKYFDRNVIEELELIYQEINQSFIDNGILPDLKTTPIKRSLKGSNRFAEQETRHEDSQLDQESYEILSVLSELLALKRGNVQSQTSQQVKTDELISVLSNIQLINPGLNEDGQGNNEQATIDVRGQLKNQLSAAVAGQINQGALGQFNDDMIDVVTMLFDFILDDENLHAEVKAIIARLQIPILKVGLVDRTFFSNRRHSARLLLNELAHAGLSWEPNDNSAELMFKQIKSVVEAICSEFNDDVQIFDQMLENFVNFKNNQQKRAKIFEKRTCEAEEGKAKTEGARARVNAELLKICHNQKVPEVVQQILKQVWVHVMFLEALKADEESWKTICKLAKMLVWSVQPVKDKERLEQLIKTVPVLIKNLKLGFTKISFSQMESSGLLDRLEDKHRQIIAEAREVIKTEEQEVIIRLQPISPYEVTQNAKIAIEAEKTSEIENELEEEKKAAELIIEEIAFSQEEIGVQKKAIKYEINVTNNSLQVINNLHAGSWFELHSEEGFKRCKLAARIISSGKFIFVNRNGVKMAEYFTEELAAEYQVGNLKILDDEALFDRALESVISNLRSMKA